MLLFGVLLAIVSFLVFGIWLKWDLIFNIGFYAGMFFSWYFFIKAIIVVTKYKLQKIKEIKILPSLTAQHLLTEVLQDTNI